MSQQTCKIGNLLKIIKKHFSRQTIILNFALNLQLPSMPQQHSFLPFRLSGLTFTLVLSVLYVFVACDNKEIRLTDTHPSRFSTSSWSNNTRTIQFDGHDCLWIGTDIGVQVYDGSNYRLFSHDKSDTTTLRSNEVVDIFKDRGDSMWVVTKDGIDRYEGKGIFRHFYHDTKLTSPACISQTEDGRIVALFGGELCSLSGNRFKRCCRLSQETVYNASSKIYRCGGGKLLVNTETGVFVVDSSLTRFNPLGLPLSASRVTCADKDHIYILSFKKGITCVDRKTLRVTYYSGEAMPVVPDEAVVWRGRLYFSGHDGVYSMDLRSYVITPLSASIQRELVPEQITKMYVTPGEDLYIGYNRCFGIKKLHSIEALTHQIYLDNTYGLLKRHGVVGVAQDGMGNILGALDNDSIFFIDRIGSISTTSLNQFIDIHSQQHVNSVLFSAGYFWVITTSSLFVLSFDNGFHMAQYYDFGLNHSSISGCAVPFDDGVVVDAGHVVVVFDAQHKNENVSHTGMAPNRRPVVYSIGNFNIKTLRISNGLINTGTPLVNLGKSVLALPNNARPFIMDLQSGAVRSSKLQLSGTFICSARLGRHTFIGTDNGLSIYDNGSGRLTEVSEIGHRPVNNLVVTERGILATCEGNIISFDPATRRIDTIWTSSPDRDFQPQTLAWAGGDRIMAATRQGFGIYTVMRRQPHEPRPQLFIESVDAELSYDKHRSCDLFGADSATTVVLDHSENTFKIVFAAVTSHLSPHYAYRYRLKGYENNWQYSDAGGEVEYTKVKPGNYCFEIECTDQQRPWIKVSKSVNLRVSPHPMLSSFALSVYVLVALVLAFMGNRLYIRMRMVRIKAETAAKEKEREQNINQMNMDFFTNISNEFRNPITMITGPVNVLRHAPELSRQSGNMVRLISQSAGILQKLVSQMLDFNLLEGSAMRLSVRLTDVAAIITEYSRHYEVSAAEKGIHIINIGNDKPMVMFADEDNLIKVFDNLMSNALKHTPEHGTITVSMTADAGKWNLTVENTGSHIPDSSLSGLFDRYYQASGDVVNWGVGLGLFYVRSLVALHHGTITAANTSGGVVFTVSLPLKDVYSEDEKKVRSRETNDPFRDDDIVRPIRHDEVTDAKKHTVLIVEKDLNTAYFLRRILEEHYNVVNRYDAESALSLVPGLHPDVIISCIMFDGMSGLDFCRELHADDQLRDIPFIFLTTLDGGDRQAEGMRVGADAYITKPFYPEYLKAVVANILASADKYKILLAKLPQPTAKTQSGLSAKDKEILRTMKKFMNDNISDGDLDVDKLSRKLLLSRTKLYEKVKSLTGKTPNELFRTFKLNYAAQLLKEGKLNVSEVAEKAGFSSVAFFSRTFKKYYGVSPKQYE